MYMMVPVKYITMAQKSNMSMGGASQIYYLVDVHDGGYVGMVLLDLLNDLALVRS